MGNFDENFKNYLSTLSALELKVLVPSNMDEAFQTEIANIRMNKKKTKIRSFSDSDFEDSGGKIEI